jgi:hypothetical protein
VRCNPAPHRVAPVRIRVGAFGPGRPVRDLLLSPEHSLLVDGVLIPVTRLADGGLVARDDGFAVVTYWHVELDRHDVLLAEGVPAESFLDTGNRALFAGEAGVRPLFPHFAVFDAAALAVWRALGCAPLCLDGPRLDAARAALRTRATALGWRISDDPAVALFAGDARLAVRTLPGGLSVRLPARTAAIRLRSATFVPAEQDISSGDARRLGVAVAGATFGGAPLPPCAFATGWHSSENGPWRWSDGDAILHLPRATRPTPLELRLDPPGRYWRMPPARRAAARMPDLRAASH